jgi:hypothetical protein
LAAAAAAAALRQVECWMSAVAGDVTVPGELPASPVQHTSRSRSWHWHALQSCF